MDLIIELMSRAANLSFEVNQLMPLVDSKSMNTSFIEGAERGMNHEDFDLDSEEMVELFKKRKAAFEINNRVVFLISSLIDSEKIELASKVVEMADYYKDKATEMLISYEKLLDTITQPNFTFDGNEHYKKDIIDTKDNYARYKSVALYFENMVAYLKPYVRSK